MDCNIVFLSKQNYMGIQTKVLFNNHDETDFHKLHLEVINSDIRNIDLSARFMAMDSDFQSDSFCYTPLVPVMSFEGDGFFRFTRLEGEYYSFNVQIKDLGPKWFNECAKYIKHNNLKIDRMFDLEYYAKDYMHNIKSRNFNFQNETIQLIFRKLNTIKI